MNFVRCRNAARVGCIYADVRTHSIVPLAIALVACGGTSESSDATSASATDRGSDSDDGDPDGPDRTSDGATAGDGADTTGAGPGSSCPGELQECSSAIELVEDGGVPRRMLSDGQFAYWQLGAWVARVRPGEAPDALFDGATDFAVAQDAVWIATDTGTLRLDLATRVVDTLDDAGPVLSIVADVSDVIVAVEGQGILSLDLGGGPDAQLSIQDATRLTIDDTHVYFTLPDPLGSPLLRIPRAAGASEEVWHPEEGDTLQEVAMTNEGVVVVTSFEVLLVSYDLRTTTMVATLTRNQGQFGPFHDTPAGSYLWRTTEVADDMRWILVDIDLSTGEMNPLALLHPGWAQRTTVVGDTLFVADHQSALAGSPNGLPDAVYSLPACGCTY